MAEPAKPGTFTRTCAHTGCGKTFTTTNVRKRFCTNACRTAAHHANVRDDVVNVRVRAAREALRRLAEATAPAAPEVWNAAWSQIDDEMDDIARTFTPTEQA